MICPTYPQFETFVRVTLDAMIEPLQRARGSGTQVEGVMETAASVLVAVAHESFGAQVNIDDAVIASDIKRKVYDYMDLLKWPGDENTPDPPRPDFTLNAAMLVLFVKGAATYDPTKFYLCAGTVQCCVGRAHPWYFHAFGRAEYDRSKPVLSDSIRSKAQPIVDAMNAGTITVSEGQSRLDAIFC